MQITRRERLMGKIAKLEAKWKAFQKHNERQLVELDKERERQLRKLEREWNQYDDKITKGIDRIDRQLVKLPDDSRLKCRR